MASKILQKLAALDRPEIPMTVTSADGSQELNLIYRRPTLAQDQVLQKTLQEEFDAVLNGLKQAHEGEQSVFDKLVKQYVEMGKENAVNYIIRGDLFDIRMEVLRENDLKPIATLPEDASEEEKQTHAQEEADFLDVFKPAFDQRYEEKRKLLVDQNNVEELAARAANKQITERAQERALEVHRRNLVSQSLYGRDPDDKDAKLELVFENADEVAEWLPETTVRTLAERITEELQKQRNLPFNSAGKK